MSEIGSEYSAKSEETKKLSTHYNNLNASIKEMNENYRVISEKLEVLNNKTQEHSGTMTDSSPVVKIKASIQKLSSEIKIDRCTYWSSEPHGPALPHQRKADRRAWRSAQHARHRRV